MPVQLVHGSVLLGQWMDRMPRLDRRSSKADKSVCCVCEMEKKRGRRRRGNIFLFYCFI